MARPMEGRISTASQPSEGTWTRTSASLSRGFVDLKIVPQNSQFVGCRRSAQLSTAHDSTANEVAASGMALDP